MNTDLTTIRLLGAAQLMVFIASMLSERLLASIVGSENISNILVNISKNLTRMRISNLVALINSVAILVLAVLFYIALNEQHKIIALIALVCFIAEGITLAVSKLGTHALIPLSREFVQAGAPESSYYQTLADFLYFGVDRRGYDIHMLLFCLGGILWYYLLFSSGSIPSALSLWGLISISLLSITVLVQLYDRDFTYLMILGLPYAPFEIVLGLWLMFKGFI